MFVKSYFNLQISFYAETIQVNERIFSTKYFSPIKLVSLWKLVPPCNIYSLYWDLFNQNGMDFATKISFCKTPVVDEKMILAIDRG